MKVCPICKETYVTLDIYQFCVRDGTKLQDILKCECGNDIMPSFKFCSKCGKPVNQEVKWRS